MGYDIQEFTGLTPGKEYIITTKLYANLAGTPITNQPLPITATMLLTNVTDAEVVLSGVGNTNEAIDLTTTWTPGGNEQVTHVKYDVNSSAQTPPPAIIKPISGTNTDTSTIVFPNEFKKDEILVITTTLYTSDQETDPIINQPPLIIESMSASDVAEAKVVVSDIDDTNKTIDLTTIWINGVAEQATHIKYVIESSAQATIIENIKLTSEINTDMSTITFPVELIEGETLTITATLYTSDQETNPIKVQPAPITKTISYSNVTEAKVAMSDIGDTNKTVDLITTWTDGIDEQASHIKYEIKSSEQLTITENIKPTSGTNIDTTTITFPDALVKDERLTITATLYISDQETDPIKEQPPEKIITIRTAPTEMIMIVDNKTDIEITIKNNWGVATINKPITSSYSIALASDPGVTIEDITKPTPVSGEETTFTGLIPDTDYIITARLGFNQSIRDFDQTLAVSTMTEKATEMTIVASAITKTSITITNTWIDGYIPVVSSSYTITEVGSESTKVTTDLYTQTITNDTITTPGTDTVIFGILDTLGPLTANTKYSITGTLNLEDGSSFDIAEPLIVTTLVALLVEEEKGSGQAIAGIVIGSFFLIILLIAGGYWAYNKYSE